MNPTFGTGGIFSCVAHLYIWNIERQADAPWRKYFWLHKTARPTLRQRGTSAGTRCFSPKANLLCKGIVLNRT